MCHALFVHPLMDTWITSIWGCCEYQKHDAFRILENIKISFQLSMTFFSLGWASLFQTYLYGVDLGKKTEAFLTETNHTLPVSQFLCSGFVWEESVIQSVGGRVWFIIWHIYKAYLMACFLFYKLSFLLIYHACIRRFGMIVQYLWVHQLNPAFSQLVLFSVPHEADCFVFFSLVPQLPYLLDSIATHHL